MMEYKKVFDKIEELAAEHVDFWKRIVEIDSPAAYKEGVDRVGACFIEIAERNGWTVEKLVCESAGDPICITMNEGADGVPVVLSGHMDTVHPVGSFATEIEGEVPGEGLGEGLSERLSEKTSYGTSEVASKVLGGIMRGPGVGDCKGGLVAALLAMNALKEAGYTERPVKLFLQSDEEVSSVLSNKKSVDFMIEKAKGAACFLNTEIWDGKTVVLARKGIIRFKVRVAGKAAHSSLREQGRSAIVEASHKILELEKFQEEGNISVNVGLVSGGTAPNSVPAECEFTVDVRFNDADSMERAERYVREVCARTYVDGTVTEVSVMSSRPPYGYDDRNKALLRRMNEIWAEAGMSELGERKIPGGSDAAYVSACGVPTVDSLGVVAYDVHSREERAEIGSLAESAKRMAAVVVGI